MKFGEGKLLTKEQAARMCRARICLTPKPKLLPSYCAYKSAQTAIKEYHRLGDSTHRKVFSHRSGDWKPNIKVLARVIFGALLSLQVVPSHCCLPWPFLCVCSPASSPSCKDNSSFGLEPQLYDLTQP